MPAVWGRLHLLVQFATFSHIVIPISKFPPFQLHTRPTKCAREPQLFPRHATGFPTTSFGNDEKAGNGDIYVKRYEL